jgi:CRISPR-associated protein Csm5
MQGDVVWRLRAIPLTPIHVGDGTLLSPESWRLAGDWLEQLAATAVLRDMASRTRKDYLDALDRGQLQAAHRLLQAAARPEHVLARVAVGADARDELAEAVGNPLRRGEIRPHVRTGGRPYLPGSSLKGAIRTALLSALAPEHRHEIEDAKRRHPPPRTGPASDEAQRLLLGHESTDQDPFRFVRVSDILLPEGATRIDRVVNWRPTRLIRNGRQPAEQMQMTYERVRASFDGADCPTGEVALTVAVGALKDARRRDSDGRKTPSFALDALALLRAVNDFHWRLLDEESERFYADHPEITGALATAFRVRSPAGELDAGALRRREDVLLMRIGRFGQFESKSLHGVRQGWNPQARPPRATAHGNTRNLVRTAEHAPLVPLGWLLLGPPDLAPVASAAPPAKADATSPPKSAPRRFLLDGEPVEVISRDADQWTVRLSSGDVEVVAPGDLEEAP